MGQAVLSGKDTSAGKIHVCDAKGAALFIVPFTTPAIAHWLLSSSSQISL